MEKLRKKTRKSLRTVQAFAILCTNKCNNECNQTAGGTPAHEYASIHARNFRSIN